MKFSTFRSGNASRILPPVLKHLQTVIKKLIDGCRRYYAQNPTHFKPPIGI
ncbi:MAG TPA: hypothetical protein PKZ19_16845 [Zoogloea sp.]|uniref:hypothetical protein n=1 Tax=Zoogloea sp. TaxID=49181 RepID=UPI002BD8A46E|nr:hypothetical protein [Zoogloea sp.]